MESVATYFARLLRENLKEGIVSVVLYGSTARGRVGPDSDIDILIVARNLPEEYHRRINLIFPLLIQTYRSPAYQKLGQWGLHPKIEYLLLDEEEAQSISGIDLDLLTDHRILYDSGFFAKKMARLLKRLKRLGAKKVVVNRNAWYWDLKPDLKPGEEIEL